MKLRVGVRVRSRVTIRRSFAKKVKVTMRVRVWMTTRGEEGSGPV